MKKKDKKDKKTVKEEIKELLDDAMNDDSIPDETKNLLSDLSDKLDNGELLSKKSFIKTNILMFFLKLCVSFIIMTALSGFLFPFINYKNLYLFLVILVLSISMGIVNNILTSISFTSMGNATLLYIIYIVGLCLLNTYLVKFFIYTELVPIFYITSDLLTSVVTKKLLRRKLWVIF